MDTKFWWYDHLYLGFWLFVDFMNIDILAFEPSQFYTSSLFLVNFLKFIMHLVFSWLFLFLCSLCLIIDYLSSSFHFSFSLMPEPSFFLFQLPRSMFSPSFSLSLWSHPFAPATTITRPSSSYQVALVSNNSSSNPLYAFFIFFYFKAIIHQYTTRKAKEALARKWSKPWVRLTRSIARFELGIFC